MPKPPSITRIGLRGREFLAVEVGGTEHLRGPFCVKDFSDSIFPDQNFVSLALAHAEWTQVRGVSGLRRREWGGLPSPTRLQLVRKSPHGADYRGKSSLGRRPGWRTRCSIRLRLCGASEEERHRHAPNTLVRTLWAMKCRSNGSFKILSLCSFDSSTSRPSWTQFSRSFSEKM